MTAFLFIGFAAIFFIWGIFFILRGLKTSAIEQKVVPISDIKEIQEIKEGYMPPAASATETTDSIATQLFKSKASPAKDIEVPLELLVTSGENILSSEQEITNLNEKLFQQAKEARQRIDQLILDNQRLTEALERELNSKSVASALVQENNEISEMGEMLAVTRNAQEELTKENQRLQKILEEERGKSEENRVAAVAAQSQLDQNQKQADDRIKALEQELMNVLEEKKIASKQQEVLNRLNIENQNLVAQLKIQSESILHFKEMAATLKFDYEGRLKEAHQIIEQLKSQDQSWRLKQEKQESEQINQLTAIIDQLKKEKEQSNPSNLTLDQDYQKIKELNAQLLEKEKILQYELTKSKAQALGLERICEDFKIQIDEMTKAAGSNKR